MYRRIAELMTAEYQDVNFGSRNRHDIQLSGWLIPAKLGPRAVVNLCHGHLGNRLEMLRTALMLRMHHFTTLVFDFRAR